MSPKNSYKVFYASRDESGIMWCPSCRAVESKVGLLFNQEAGPQAEIVYVGQREEWKKIFPAGANNPYRKAPWNVSGVPTILKLSPEGEVLGEIGGDDEILDEKRMNEFLSG